MAYETCPRCKQFSRSPCGCVPFMVYYPEYFGDEKEEVYGQSFEGVVEQIAKTLNEDEPVFDRNLFETPIEITNQNGITKRFNCTASISVDYYPKEEEEAAEQLLQPVMVENKGVNE